MIGDEDGEQRKQYHHEQFVFDARDKLYYHTETMEGYEDKVLNHLIPRDEWYTRDVPLPRGTGVRVVPIKPSDFIADIENDQVVEGSTWWPGMPRIIKDMLVTKDGERPMHGCRMLNTYSAIIHKTKGDPHMAGFWIEHLRSLWPDDAELLLDYFAHTIQHPEEKINFGIVMFGEQGIGKDMALDPIRYSLGLNCREISPDMLFSQYNSYVDCIMLIINEARPAAEEFKATNFYELLKTLTAAPPDWIPMNGKYQRQRHVRNLMRVIITTNDPLSLYVPENDRRLHFVHSKVPSKWANSDYFRRLDGYYQAGGRAHVHSFLLERDISKFNPKEKPEPNAAWNSIVASWNAPVHDPLMDVLDDLGWPPLFFGGELLMSDIAAFDNKEEVKLLLRSSRKLAGLMARHGYETVQAPNKNNGWKWIINGKMFKSRVAFVRRDFTGDIETEVEKRGTEIAANGKAARPKVVPIRSAN